MLVAREMEVTALLTVGEGLLLGAMEMKVRGLLTVGEGLLAVEMDDTLAEGPVEHEKENKCHSFLHRGYHSAL